MAVSVTDVPAKNRDDQRTPLSCRQTSFSTTFDMKKIDTGLYFLASNASRPAKTRHDNGIIHHRKVELSLLGLLCIT